MKNAPQTTKNKKLNILISILNILILLVIGSYFGASFYQTMDDAGWEKAIESYRRDVEKKNDPQAKYYIGLYMLEGKGRKKNAKEAAYWITEAAKDGNAKAQLKLAWMYETGTGVSKNKRKAKLLCREYIKTPQREEEKINESAS